MKESKNFDSYGTVATLLYIAIVAYIVGWIVGGTILLISSEMKIIGIIILIVGLISTLIAFVFINAYLSLLNNVQFACEKLCEIEQKLCNPPTHRQKEINDRNEVKNKSSFLLKKLSEEKIISDEELQALQNSRLFYKNGEEITNALLYQKSLLDAEIIDLAELESEKKKLLQ